MSTTTAITNQPTFRNCACGCGEKVASKTNYRPGHDARHASTLARAAVGTGPSFARDLFKALPSPALQAKASAMLGRLEAKAAKPSKSAKATEWREGIVMVGRWDYPARQDNHGERVERNTKRDGSGEWISANGSSATFRKV